MHTKITVSRYLRCSTWCKWDFCVFVLFFAYDNCIL